MREKEEVISQDKVMDRKSEKERDTGRKKERERERKREMENVVSDGEKIHLIDTQ